MVAHLSCDSVSVAYDTTPVLRGIDLSVEEGEIVGVMGKNGAGKSTLVKTLIGLLHPTTGTIQYDGLDITTVQAHERAEMGIGYVPQGRDIFPDLTVEENLLVGESINQDSEELLYEMTYEHFPILKTRATQKAGTLSGGQQQMLAVGRALVGNPDLLLLDEHSEGVQPSIVEEISENIQVISDELGTTILFVEQNLGVIRDLADRCYAMKRGTLVDEFEGDSLGDENVLAEFLAV